MDSGEQKVAAFLASHAEKASGDDDNKFEPISPPTLIAPVQFRGKFEKPKCAVCHEDGDGLHFGAEACRACTAFFRRSVALNKTYECRATGTCEVSSIPDIRCMCRACRFSKCLEVGMKPDCVQNRRDTIGKPEDLQKSSPSLVPTPISSIPSTSSLYDFAFLKPDPANAFAGISFLTATSTSPSLDNMPILERMRINYEKMENARSVIHRREGENIFQQKVPRAMTFQGAAEVTTKEVSLVADWVEWCFDEFSLLAVDQKTILFQNFYINFSMLEKGFMTVKSGRDNIVVMASKDYIDFANLEVFFKDCGDDGSCTPEKLSKLCRLIRPSFELQKTSLFNLMRQEDVDEYEFFVLCVFLFWDFGLQGQTEECNQIGRRVKQRVTSELSFYLKHVKKHEEPMFRLSSIVSILPTLQRAVRRFQEDIEMAHFFNIYALPSNFYNIVNGKFTQG